MKIDLKHFKKLHSNEDTTTFVHKNGHRITVAHKGLDEKTRRQMAELPKFAQGGYVETGDKYNNVKKSQQNSADQKKAEQQKVDDKNYVPQTSNSVHHIPYGYASGGTVKKDPPPPPPIDADKAKEVQDSFKKALGFADGTANVGQEFDLDLNGTKMPVMKTPLYQDSSVTSQAPYSDQFGYQPQQPQGAAPNSEQLSQVPLPQKQQQANPLAQMSSPEAMEQDMSNLTSGINMQAQAEGQMGKQEVGVEKQRQTAIKTLADHYDEVTHGINNERAAALQDYRNGHIEPNHYVQNMTNFQKGMTAIGLVLSGMGGAMAGQNSMAQQFLDKQIDRDIDAQKAEMGKKENLLSHLQQDLGNARDAATMARVMQSDFYNAKMLEVAAASKDPMAMARAKQSIAETQIKLRPELDQMKMRRAALNGLKSGDAQPEQVIPYLVPKEQQKAAFDSVGKLKDLNQNAGVMDKLFQQAAQENTVMRTGAGLARTPASVTNLQNMFLPIVKDLEGRINEYEFESVKKFIPSPGDSDSKIREKYQGMHNFIAQKNNEHSSVLKGFGIPIPQMQGQGFNKR